MDVRNTLRVLHKERGIDSKQAKAKFEQEPRLSGDVGPHSLDSDDDLQTDTPATTPDTELADANMSRWSEAQVQSDEDEEENAQTHDRWVSDALKHASLLPAFDTIQEAPDEDECDDGGSLSRLSTAARLSPHSAPPRPGPESACTSSSTSPAHDRKGKGKAPLVVETCPTPSGTTRQRPESRQRSLIDTWDLQDSSSSSDLERLASEQDESECDSYTVSTASSDVEAHCAYRRRPSTPLEPRLSYSDDPRALPYPSSVTASPASYIPRSRAPSSFAPARSLRQQISVATLLTHDLSHLPAPNTPRERPYRVSLRDVLAPSFALGGGRGSGRFGDRWGPVERKILVEPRRGSVKVEDGASCQNGFSGGGAGLRRTLSAKARRSISGFSAKSRRSSVCEPSSAVVEALEDWTTVVVVNR